MIVVPGAAHNGSLTANVWPDVEEWIVSVTFGRAPR